MSEVVKIRRADFYPDDWLAGTLVLTLEERGAYITICALIYSSADRLLDDDRYLAGVCRVDVRVWRRIKLRLIALGKLSIEDGLVRNTRCTSEINKGIQRIKEAREAGRVGGRKSARERSQDIDLTVATAEASAEANHQPAPNNQHPATHSQRRPPPPPGGAVAGDVSVHRTKDDGSGYLANRKTAQHIDVADADAVGMVNDFVRLRKKYWPSIPNSSVPHEMLLAMAQELLVKGGPRELIVEVIERCMINAVRDGKNAPSGFKAYGRSLSDEISQYTRASRLFDRRT